jgi:hypothetical protein
VRVENDAAAGEFDALRCGDHDISSCGHFLLLKLCLLLRWGVPRSGLRPTTLSPEQDQPCEKKLWTATSSPLPISKALDAWQPQGACAHVALFKQLTTHP